MANPSVTALIESLADTLVGLRPDSADDLAKLGGLLRSITTKSATMPAVQALANQIGGVLECADFPLDAETLTELHRLTHLMGTEAERQPNVAEVSDKVERDADTLALFGEFFEEAEDALTEADRILMEGDGSFSKDSVHALFRVFHTLKGVAGFLDLIEIGKVAHETETLLDHAREGTLEIGPSTHDCLIETTQLLRKLVGSVAEAVQNGTAIRSPADAVRRASEWINGEIKGETREAEAQVSTGTVVSEGESEADAAQRQRATLKVDVERVDGVLEMIGELVLLESMLAHASEMSVVQGHLVQLAKITRHLQSQAMRMRMVPVRNQFQRLPRIVRDTAKKAGKQVQLEIIGAGTEMDRGMVERLGDPLVHMLRNSVDHGVETSDVRAQAGKPEVATITVAAFYEGSSVVIEVSDDGRGLDRERILQKAISQGLVKEGTVPTDDEIYHMIFEPGFSTAAKVTELSGRGVGMDVVKKTITGLRGRIAIKTAAGEGTTFRLILPLTLAIIDAFVVRVGTERYVIPSLSIVESLKPTRWMLTTMGGHRELARFRGSVLPLFRAAELFKVPDAGQIVFGQGSSDEPRAGREEADGMLVVVDSGGQRVGLYVDEVIGQQQVVVKNLDGTIAQSESFVGAAILSDGKVALIVNVDDLGRLGEQAHAKRLGEREVSAA